MTFSTSQLVAAAFAEVAVDAQPASADETAAITARVPGVIADLQARRVAVIANANAIADALFADLVQILAERVAPLFGRPTNPESLAAAEARLANLYRRDRAQGTELVRATLERLDAVGATTEAIDATAVADAVQSVFDDLRARRVIVIANEGAISSAHKPHLVTLLAARVQPKAVSADQIATAESHLADMARRDRTASTPLVRGVLDQLARWGMGQTTTDAEAVADMVGPALASLSARNIMYLDAEDITDAALPAATRYIAALLAPKPMGDVIDRAEQELRTLSRIGRGDGRMLTVDPALRPATRRRLF